MKPFLSVIIPTHDDFQALPLALVEIDKKLSEADYSYEILVVNDGSEDKTRDMIARFSRAVKNLKFIDMSGRRGRGWAVREGMLKSAGNYRLLTDGYNSVPINFFEKMLPYFKEGSEIVIRSSYVKGARAGSRGPVYKRILSNVENLMLRVFSGPAVRDIRSDFKCFSERAAIEIFGATRINGWGFDVEVMNLAKLFDCRITEVPVLRSYSPSSILSAGKFFSALWDSARVRFWLSRGKYENRQNGK
jgi:dolichyl-phosphate beta-glucosyltransferase